MRYPSGPEGSWELIREDDRWDSQFMRETLPQEKLNVNLRDPSLDCGRVERMEPGPVKWAE